MKCTIRLEFNRKKVSMPGKIMGTSFPGCPNSMTFAAFDYAMGS